MYEIIYTEVTNLVSNHVQCTTCFSYSAAIRSEFRAAVPAVGTHKLLDFLQIQHLHCVTFVLNEDLFTTG